MTFSSVETRRPPRNALAIDGGPKGWLLARLQLFADLQVASASRDAKAWLRDRRGSLLEVGCGEQPYAKFVPRHCAYDAIDQRDMSGEFKMKESRNITYYDGDRFPVADDRYDSLFHTEVIEHVYETRTFLQECCRALKPGAEMFFTVPFQARYHFMPHDYFRFTPASLHRLLSEAGFDTITVVPRGNDITVAAYKVAAVGFRWAYGGWGGKMLFVLASPIIVAALLLAHAASALALGSSDDCLGYSVIARRATAAR